MILICPSCGATHSADAWENDVKIRKTLQATCTLPAEVSRVLLPYLGLFRPEKRALTWTKSLKIIGELQQLIAQGHIQVQGKVSRPCPPRIWAQGMEQMSARTDLSRPMKNHNYLRQIVYQLADQADAGREHQQYQNEQNGNARAQRASERQQPRQDSRVPKEEPLSQLERQWVERYGTLPGEEQGEIKSMKDLTAWASKSLSAGEEGANG